MTFSDRVLQDLNIKQQEAVLHKDRPLLVLSGAGTGKTKTIAYKIAYYVLEKHYSLNRVLALTFTNKAAKEMRERTKTLLSQYIDLTDLKDHQIYIGTFHSNCIKILRWHGRILGYTSSFSIIDRDDQSALIKKIVKEHGLKYLKKPSETINLLSHYKNDFLKPEDLEKLAQENNDLLLKDLSVVYKEYQKELLLSNSMDFDDIQLNVIYLFNKDPEILRFWQNHFQAILVDEFQDTNPVQFLLLKQLSSLDYTNITFVGDDDQSIYSFRGANIGNILNLNKEITHMTTIKLEQNYRSTPSILYLANHIISENENRLGKNLYTKNIDTVLPTLVRVSSDEEEVSFCLDKIEEFNTTDEKIAIIYRTKQQSRIFERELISRNIAYHLLGGNRFLEKKEIKDILAYLKILSNPKDNLAILRVINIPTRGIGDMSKERLYHYAAHNNLSLLEVLKSIPKDIKITQHAKEKIKDWVTIISDLTETVKTHPHKVLSLLLEALDYFRYLNEYDGDERKTNERLHNIYELERSFDKHLESGKTFTEFVENLSLMDSSDAHTQYEQEPFITLATVHGCKGLEFDHVFIVGLVEEIFPHYLTVQTQEQLEEERRLCYVAITRAKKTLYLLSANTMSLRGYKEPYSESRFIKEIPSNLIHRIQKKWYEDFL